MTYEDCIVHLKSNIEKQQAMKDIALTYGGKMIHENCIEMYRMEIDALEKQIPKKPIGRGIRYMNNRCSSCHNDISVGQAYGIVPLYDYCPCCGQAIDWSEE